MDDKDIILKVSVPIVVMSVTHWQNKQRPLPRKQNSSTLSIVCL